MQLELFPTRAEPPKRSPAWGQLSAEERAAAVEALARLMAKATRPKRRRESDEQK